MLSGAKKFYILIVADCIALGTIVTVLLLHHIIPVPGVIISIAILSIYLFIRYITNLLRSVRFSEDVSRIRDVVGEFKKGKFYVQKEELVSNILLEDMHRDLVTVGKHLEDLMSTQKSEIKNLREMYNIVLSSGSYLITINEVEEILFVNESFCKKFQYDVEDVIGKKIDDVFYFITGSLQEGLKSVIDTGIPIILEKSHLLSRNRISVIGNIKLSSIMLKGKSQIVIVIDDITNKCRKDYQISLISQVSESIQRDDEIDNVLSTILTAVTSGSGLGFNRAMLFLIDENDNTLKGKMAVGPDSMDQAIEIWSSLDTNGKGFHGEMNQQRDKNRKGRELLKNVLATQFDLESDSLLTEAVKTLNNIHIKRASEDDRVDPDFAQFVDADEFVIVPLVSIKNVIGIIIADNKFNRMPIGDDSIDLLSIFAFQAALSIEGYNNLMQLRTEMQKIRDRQDAIIESEKLAAVGRIALHIAHEIRNPLVTMGGYAKRIYQAAQNLEKDEKGIMKSSNVILKESERLEKILSNVMDFTRESPIIMGFNDINEIIEDTKRLLNNLFQERKIQVSLNLRSEIPMVKSDFNQIKQVMLNLLQNAIDASPVEGRIEVITDIDENEKNLVIIVRNSGSMITEEDPGIIFEPFYTDKVTGVGLGLAIVKKIVLDHNGEISVSNMKDDGVEFKVLLPLPGQ